MYVVKVLTCCVETIHSRKTKSGDSSSGTSGKMDTRKIIDLYRLPIRESEVIVS